MSTALVTHRDCVKHEISAGHPECPQRIDAINDQLMKQDIFDHLRHLDAPLASREALMLAHPEAYVDMIHAMYWPPTGYATVRLAMLFVLRDHPATTQSVLRPWAFVSSAI